MKKIVILFSLLALSLGAYSCGGGGAGPADVPPGENPGIPSVVQLLPAQYIAQTNAYITLNAKVLDGNGMVVPNVSVTFTNLSSVGVLSTTVASTNGIGIATVTLYSTTPGFATVLAQVTSGAGQVRDRKTVFFSSQDVLAVSMDMDVDSVPGNGIYNEPSDLILFEPPPSPDDTFEVLATVRNAGGVPVAGESVTWSASHSEVKTVRTETTTNINGQAKGVFQVTPSSIRNTETHINIMAYADNGAANMVTLFLRPVVVDPTTSSVTANPTIVDTSGTSTITAVVMLNTGAWAPDGTTVNFTASCGTVTPFAQTTGGVATATFTAPSTPGTCTVTAKVGGVTIGSVDILVKAKLQVIPASQTVAGGSSCAATSQSATYTIIGGVAPYNVSTSHPTNTSFTAPTAGDSTTVSASGGTFTIAYDVTLTGSPPSDTTVTITVVDAVGTTATADFKIDCP